MQMFRNARLTMRGVPAMAVGIEMRSVAITSRTTPIAGRAPPPQILGDRLTNIGGQRQTVLPSAPTHHEQLGCPPIDVIEAQAGHRNCPLT